MWVPRAAEDGRLVPAVGVDALLAVGVAVALTAILRHPLGDPLFVPMLVGATVGTSLVNHVAGTGIFGGSVGKLLLGLRVVRADDGGRPGLARLVGRWLLGYVIVALFALAEDGGGIGEAFGLRVVRRADLRRHH